MGNKTCKPQSVVQDTDQVTQDQTTKIVTKPEDNCNNNNTKTEHVENNNTTDSNNKIDPSMTSIKTDSAWTCEKCTFVNEPKAISCAICYHSRFEIKNMSVQWQWQADQRWISYDYETILQIENEYQNKSKECNLSKDFFSSQKGYKIGTKKIIISMLFSFFSELDMIFFG